MWVRSTEMASVTDKYMYVQGLKKLMLSKSGDAGQALPTNRVSHYISFSTESEWKHIRNGDKYNHTCILPCA